MAKIFITKFDKDRLMTLLDKKLRLDEYDKTLLTELKIAQVVEPQEIPNDIITMNSKCLLKDDDGSDWEYTLVFPEDADYEHDKISILSPIGCSLIGNKVGSAVTFPSPKGSHEMTLMDILYQPERSGHMDV